MVFDIIFGFLVKNKGKNMCHIKFYILQLLHDEEHGHVLDNVHHGLLEVREGVSDIIFAFLMKN